MNETDFVGTSVRYSGNSRDGLRGHLGTVAQVTSSSVGVRYPDGIAEIYKGSDGLVWASRWAWTVANSGYVLTNDILNIENAFSEAAGGPREIIVNEISRLKARLADLEKALEVIDSL